MVQMPDDRLFLREIGGAAGLHPGDFACPIGYEVAGRPVTSVEAFLDSLLGRGERLARQRARR